MSEVSAPRFETDAVVIGAGPVGLFTVFEFGMAKMRCHVVDALEAIGGQLTALYPEKPIYDIPGFRSIEARDLVERLAAQAEPFEPVYHLGVTVSSLIRLPDGRWELGLSDGSAIIAWAVAIAAGAGAFGPQRPPLEGLSRFEGKSVRYWVAKRDEMAGKHIVIAGGGDSAIDWALSLVDVAKSVAVVHRRAKFRAAPASEAKLQALAAAGRIDLVVPYQLAAVSGEGDCLTEVVVSGMDGEIRTLAADMLLPFFGLSSALGPIAQWGLTMEANRIQVDPATMATNLPGVFALGDVAVYTGKMKLILQGFAEAAAAAAAAYPFAHDGQALHFAHSTTAGVQAAGTGALSS